MNARNACAAGLRATRNGTRRAARRLAALLLTAGLLLAAIGATSRAAASTIKFDFQASHPLVDSTQKQTIYLKLGLVGEEPVTKSARPPINVAIVLDKSGSMQGDGKIGRAREAAILALETLAAEDIVSVVTYDSTVQVLVPATKLTSRDHVINAIRGIQPGGSTALFSGVSKGAEELRKFVEQERINRLILLSDGMANIGPSAPSDLGELGGSLRKEGISVSTIGLGLGYSEDLMTQLAARSDGNHYFAENGHDLARIYESELGRVQAVVAKKVRIDIECAEGVRPVRVLGREAEISGRRVWLDLNQLYTGIERSVVLEVEVPAGSTGQACQLAEARVQYFDMLAEKEDNQAAQLSASYSDSREAIDKARNTAVMASAVELIGVENNRRAMQLRDEGKTDEARQVLFTNQAYLEQEAFALQVPALKNQAQENEADAQHLEEGLYLQRRKEMQSNQAWRTY